MTEENLFVPQQTEKKQINFATVAAVHDDGLTLIFDGEQEPSEKHYKCNAFVVFQAGDRVRIIEDSGTYVAEYPVGVPKKTFVAEEAETAEKAETFSRRHTGSTLSFFNLTGATNQKIVKKITSASSATTSTIANKVNELITALDAYNLISM